VGPSPLSVWEFERGVDPGLAARTAMDDPRHPDLRVLLTFSGGDMITVRVLDGAPSDPDALLYVQGCGLFEIERIEEWPPPEGSVRPRTLLTLHEYGLR
jgi:hypothetical protein